MRLAVFVILLAALFAYAQQCQFRGGCMDTSPVHFRF